MFKNLNPFRIILAVLILFIPLYPKFPLLGVTGTYVAIRLEDIVIGLFLAFFFIYQLKKRFPIFKNKIILVFIAYFIAISISALTAILIYQNTPVSIIILNTLRRLEYMSLFFMTLEAIKNKKDFLYPYLFLLLALIGIATYGYGQKYLQFPVISTMNEEFSKGQLLQMNVWTRISSTFAGHYDLAAYLSLILVIIGAVTILTKNKLLKISSFILFLVGFNLLTLTASRVSIFAFWGSLTLCLLLLRRYLWIIPLSAMVIFSFFNSKDLNQRLLATISIFKINNTSTTPTPTSIPTSTPIPSLTLLTPTKTLATTITLIPEKPTPTIFHHPVIEDVTPADLDAGVARSGEIRFNVEWPRAITAFRKNPLTGTGLGSITLATDNDYLRSLGESGILGFSTFAIIFLTFSLKTIPFIWKKNKNIYQQIPLVLFSVMICALVNATFIDVFEASKVAYTIWIIMAIYYQSLHQKYD